ncbi:MAG: isocitrate lyase/phosphoenolpyruvate mutase family protein, partial [Candidatus Omnitrophota bacterium]|nr:isocitrate lyase/phosphoenolpyruvate mutase family protein [Candidatus Omnitrophota bacterium]
LEGQEIRQPSTPQWVEQHVTNVVLSRLTEEILSTRETFPKNGLNSLSVQVNVSQDGKRIEINHDWKVDQQVFELRGFESESVMIADAAMLAQEVLVALRQATGNKEIVPETHLDVIDQAALKAVVTDIARRKGVLDYDEQVGELTTVADLQRFFEESVSALAGTEPAGNDGAMIGGQDMEARRKKAKDRIYVQKEGGRYFLRKHGVTKIAATQHEAEGTRETSNHVAIKFNQRLMDHTLQGTSIRTFGPFDESSADAMVRKGAEATYLGGWAESARRGVSDQARSPYTYLAEFPARLSRHLIQKARIQAERRSRMSDEEKAETPEHDFLLPLFVDVDTGHEAPMELVKVIMTEGEEESLVAAIHLEDQAHGCKKCGHMNGKVLVSTAEHIATLNKARLALDRMNLDTLLVARTDSEAADSITSILDPRDQPFILGATNVQIRPYNDVIEEARNRGASGSEIAQIDKDWRRDAQLKPMHIAVAEKLESLGRTKEAEEFRQMGMNANFGRVKERAKELGLEVISSSVWKDREKSIVEGVLAASKLDLAKTIMWDANLTSTSELQRTLWMINSGHEMAMARAIHFSDYADIVWEEQHHPNVEETKTLAKAISDYRLGIILEDGERMLERTGYTLRSYLSESIPEAQRQRVIEEIHKNLKDAVAAKYDEDKFIIEQFGQEVNRILAAMHEFGLGEITARNLMRYVLGTVANNTSPSFYWRAQDKTGHILTNQELQEFGTRQGRFAQFQFVTYLGSELDHYFTGDFYERFQKDGMLAVANFQDEAIRNGDEFVGGEGSQKWAGVGLNAALDTAGSGAGSVASAVGAKDTVSEGFAQAKREKKEGGGDAAQIAEIEPVAVDAGPTRRGGIDLNSNLLDLQIKRDGNGVPLPLPLQPLQNMRIDGFYPVIINITPVANLPLLLGMAREEDVLKVSSLN